MMAELSVLKDAQLRMNTQIERLNKVVFGIAKQVDELVGTMEREKEEEDWRHAIPHLPPKLKK